MTSIGTIEPVRVAVTVAVPPERAWEVFTSELPRWWPVSTHSVAAADGQVPDRLVVEPGVGGEIYELIGSVRRDWARFTAWEPPHRLAYQWHVNPENPPTEVVVTFTPAGAGTTVEVVHSGWEAYGDNGPALRASYGSDEGWATVLEHYRTFA